MQRSSLDLTDREDFVAWYFMATANVARMSPEERDHVCSSVMKTLYDNTLFLIQERNKLLANQKDPTP